jgi:imidazole glycerol-phosphate synthase subunit HisH
VKKRTIGIIDYGAGNLSSVYRSLCDLGHRCRISRDPDVLNTVDLLLLPGVGAFPSAMKKLCNTGMDAYIQKNVRQGKPLIGICLGMQMLLDESSEHRLTAGLGLIPGSVNAFAQTRWHIGWNTLEVTSNDLLLKPSDGAAFYFNHSYIVNVPPEYQVGISRVSEPFVVAIRRGLTVGLQFHPEKSQDAGRRLLGKLIEGLTA